MQSTLVSQETEESVSNVGARGQESGNSSDARQMAEQRQKQEMMKNQILSQVLDKAAMARLSNLTVAKPEKSQAVENLIITMARTGQIRGKMADDDLKRLLDKIAGNSAKTAKVNYDRRRVDSDEEFEETVANREGASSSSDED